MVNIQEVGGRLAKDGVSIATRWRIAGKWAQALALLEGVLPLSDTLEDAVVAQLYLTKAQVLNDQALFGGIPNRAERDETLAQALAHAERTNDKVLLGALWSIWGMSLHISFFENQRTAEPAHEMEYFERGLALRTEANDAFGIAESLFQIGLVYQVVRQDTHASLPYFQQSYDHALALNDDMLRSYAIRHIGFARAEQGDMRGAEAALEESLRLRRTIGFMPGVAMAELGLAQVFIEKGEFSLALPLLEHAHDTFIALHNVERAKSVENDIARLRL